MSFKVRRSFSRFTASLKGTAYLLAFAPLVATAGMHEFNGENVHIKLGIDIPGYDLLFKGQNREIKYNPNADTLFSVGVSLQDFLGITWGFRNTQQEKDKIQKGKTDYEDWRLNLAFKQFHVKFNYAKFKGFYIQDSSEVDPTWSEGEPFYQKADLVSQNIGVNFTWIFSPGDFSLVAAYDQTERQEKSGGSFLAGAAVSETLFEDESQIIPANVQPAFGTHQRITEGRFQSFTVKGGYGYTFVLAKKYFAALSGQFGFGRQYMKIKGTDFADSTWAPAKKGDLILSLGYNGDDYYAGVFASGDQTDYKTGEMEIAINQWMARLYFGFRL